MNVAASHRMVTKSIANCHTAILHCRSGAATTRQRRRTFPQDLLIKYINILIFYPVFRYSRMVLDILNVLINVAARHRMVTQSKKIVTRLSYIAAAVPQQHRNGAATDLVIKCILI